MGIDPIRFRQMDYEDCILAIKGYNKKMQVQEGWIRRSTYIIAQMNASKDIANSFNAWWPYGDGETNQQMGITVDEFNRRRERSKQLAVGLVNNLNLKETIKKVGKYGRRSSDTNRR